MRSVAAITFTEKAAAELRDRVRGELEQRARDAGTPRRPCASGAREALDELDDAAICTLHSFAQRILTAFPVEAGLPPRIEVRDEVSSLLAFDERWRRTRDDLLDDPELEPAVLVTLAAGATLEHLRRVAEYLDDNWDLLDRIDDAAGAARRSISTPWLAELDARVRDGRSTAPTATTSCSRTSASSRSTATGCAPRSTTRRGSSCSLADKPSFQVALRAARRTGPTSTRCATRIKALGEQRTEIVRRVTDAALRRVVELPRAAHRRARGRAAAAPASSSSTTCSCSPVRCCATRSTVPTCGAGCASGTSGCSSTSSRTPTRSRSRSPRCSRPPTIRTSTRATGSSIEVDAGPAVLRRRPEAVDLPLPARRHRDVPRRRATASPTSRVRLTSNFRSTEPVLAWVNHVFGRPDPGRAAARSPSTSRSRARAPAAPSGPGCAAARCRRRSRPGSRPTRLREREAASVAAAVRAAIDERWQVGDGQRRVARRAPRRRLHPVAGAHVAVLPRARARRRRHLVPRRDELARVRHARGPRPARWRCARSTTRATSSRS